MLEEIELPPFPFPPKRKVPLIEMKFTLKVIRCTIGGEKWWEMYIVLVLDSVNLRKLGQVTFTGVTILLIDPY